VGRPNLSFGEGDRVILCKIPAHVCARAELVVEHFKGGILDRLRAFLRPSAEKHASQVESTSVGSWDIDGDFVLERAELTVIQQEGSIPKIEVTLLDLEMDLPWPLPNELLEKVAEGIGKDIISARLPSGALPEVPLPPEMPFKVKIEDIKVSTCSGRLLVQANIGVVPEGDPTVAKQMIEGRIRDVMPSGL